MVDNDDRYHGRHAEKTHKFSTFLMQFERAQSHDKGEHDARYTRGSAQVTGQLAHDAGSATTACGLASRPRRDFPSL